MARANTVCNCAAMYRTACVCVYLFEHCLEVLYASACFAVVVASMLTWIAFLSLASQRTRARTHPIHSPHPARTSWEGTENKQQAYLRRQIRRQLVFVELIGIVAHVPQTLRSIQGSACCELCEHNHALQRSIKADLASALPSHRPAAVT